MALNNISFVKGKGGLGRPLPGKDYISGLVFYAPSLPSGFSTSNRVQVVYSTEQAETLGILADYSDETRATTAITVSNAGAIGDQVTINSLEPGNTTVSIVTYTRTAAATTATTIAAAIAAAINNTTATHGYTATSAAAVITLTFRKGLGIYPNTGTPITILTTGTIAASVTTPASGGVASRLAVWHYHVSEFFRIQPKGFLWLGFFAVPGTYDYTELQTVQTAAQGAIRQFGVYVDSKAYAVGDLSLIQTVCNGMDVAKTGVSVVYAGNIAAVTDLTTLSDLSLLNNNKVSVTIAQDGAGLGAQLYAATGKSITDLGACLGAVALSAVQEDIAWVAKFNQSSGTELETLAFANGTLLSNAVVTGTFLDAIDLKRYIFLRKLPNRAGSYYNDNHCAIAQSSDYAYINDNRVIDKAIRGVDSDLLPSLNAPLLLNADGTLANSTIAALESQGVASANQMVRDGEISSVTVTIDPTQVVASTSTLIVAVDIVPIGVARNIIVNIGYKLS